LLRFARNDGEGFIIARRESASDLLVIARSASASDAAISPARSVGHEEIASLRSQ